MRVLVVCGVLGLGSMLVGCGSTSTGGSSSAGSSSSSSAGGSASSSTSGGSSSSGSASSSTGGGGSCELKASCAATDKACVGLVSNAGQTKLGLRMSQLDISAPAGLTGPPIAGVFANALKLALPACNQGGSGTFSWLLQLDTAAQTLTTGGAKPVADPTQGYAFDDEMSGGQHIQPVTFTNVAPDASGQFSVTVGQDLVIPAFLDPAGSMMILLPLHQARITQATLSSNNDCIGTYNAAGLDPTNSCMPDDTHAGFIDGGSVEGYIALADADNVIVPLLNMSLCALLARNMDMYTELNASGGKVCKHDAISGNVVYQGDWCAMMNVPAGASCADAVSFKANFAASSVKIN